MLQFLEHKLTSNILSIVTILLAVAALIIAYIGLPQSTTKDVTGSNLAVSELLTRTNLSLIIFIFLLSLFCIIKTIASRIRIKQITTNVNLISKRQELIGKLSKLQGSYILKPKYTTATQHGGHSKESKLSSGGTADILTNSLKYDMFYSKEIAENIINGAKYIYILPQTTSTLHDLQNYITKIHQSILQQLTSNSVIDLVPKLNELCKNNLEFWSFNEENSCLYNFAIFRQSAKNASQPFEQYWWYINPPNTESHSLMLAYEITEPRDKDELEEILKSLKKTTSKRNGLDVYEHRENLDDWFRGME